MDGGIRSGQDLFKALALGAKGTLIGRAFNFGLGAMGEAGVGRGARGVSSAGRDLDHHCGAVAATRPAEIIGQCTGNTGGEYQPEAEAARG